MTMETIAVSDVVFRDDLYPRINTSPETVQKYAEDLDVLPPIEVNQLNELIDGWHRWTAHKKAKAGEIGVIVTQTESDAHLLELAIERNAKFGHQLSNSDKKKMAARIYRATEPEERGAKKHRLSEILSVSYDTVNRWLGRIDKDSEEERNAAVLNLYLQCYAEEEIAEAVGCTRDVVRTVLGKTSNYEISPIPGIFCEDQPDDSATEKVRKDWEEKRQARIVEENRCNAEHSTDFAVPIYNVWKQQTKSEGSSHFGNSETTWVDRLLYLYTDPFDIVVDPFAGGGSTLDVCRKRFRRCWLSDRKPIEERAKEIRQLDVLDDGKTDFRLPDLRKRWKDVRLVYLDPPYWWQAKGHYSDDPTDLANMPLEQFTSSLAGIIGGFAKKLSAGAHIALIIQPTQWNAPERQFTDHVGDMLRAVKLPVDMRFSVPYESQQYNAQTVEWAKANKRCLVLTREIVEWRVA